MSKITSQELEKLTTQVDETLVKFIKEGKYKDVLLSMSNLNNYSFNNILLILSQNPNATRVAGFKAWKNQNRYVKGGEHALKIIMPICYKVHDDETDEDTYIVKGYQAGSVFDISQTDGEEIKNFFKSKDDIIKNKDKIISSLTKEIKQHGYTVNFVDSFDDDRKGETNHKTKQINVLNTMNDINTITCLAHECGHALAHGEPREEFKGLTSYECRQIKELEAESIAFIVSTYLGIDDNDNSCAYITEWTDGDISKFKENLSIISSCAKTLIDALEI